MQYNKMNLSNELKSTLEGMGYTDATAIQEAIIPLGIEGHDVIGQAQTGTGKTAAFLIPIIEKMSTDRRTQSLILVPTRELALQVNEVFCQLTKNHSFKSITVFGGVSITEQMKQLKLGPQCVIATPGRLLDLHRRNRIDLGNIQYLILDEVDEMLNMGFLDDVKTVMASCKKDKQTFFLSATMTKDIIKLAKSFMQDPKEIHIESKSLTAERVKQYYVKVAEDQKIKALLSFFYTQHMTSSIIFVRTKRKADELTQELTAAGIKADCIHGDLSQQQRTVAFNKFKNQHTKLLIATDVAARGLDINGISHVFNFDLPDDFEYYVHRIGRTGRIGKEGTAISFFTPRQVSTILAKYERLSGKKFENLPLPTEADIQASLQQVALDRVVEAIDAPIDEQFYAQAKQLSVTYSPTQIIAALLAKLSPTVNVKQILVKAGSASRSSDRNRSGGDRNRRSNDRYAGDRKRSGGSGSDRNRRSSHNDRQRTRSPRKSD